MAFVPFIVVLLFLGQVQSRERWQTEGEFVAGTFILTQKSLNEAPYRYAGVLRQVLDKVEQKDPPKKSDESDCSARYRIEPSGRRSQLKIMENSLSFLLQENNTLVITAKIYAEVAAKTWIWKGINFGLLGCLKLTSCSGEIVTYTAYIDLELSIQVLWRNDRMAILIKPVNTAINDVNVAVSVHDYLNPQEQKSTLKCSSMSQCGKKLFCHSDFV